MANGVPTFMTRRGATRGPIHHLDDGTRILAFSRPDVHALEINDMPFSLDSRAFTVAIQDRIISLDPSHGSRQKARSVSRMPDWASSMA